MRNNGFSLIEVLVFISVLGVFFTVAAATTILVLRSIKVNEHKLLAARYAQEASSYIKGQKEVDWNAFVQKSSVGGTTYCFNDFPISSWPASGSCSDFTGLNPAIYKREATLTNVDCSGVVCQVNVAISLQWQETGKTYNVPLKTIVSVWE